MVEPRAASLLLLSWDLWFLGYPDQSLARVSEALALGQALGHPYTVTFAHYMTSVVHLMRGDASPARWRAPNEASTCLRNNGFRCTRFCPYFARQALGELGRLGEARVEITQGIDEARRNSVRFMLPMMDSWLAEVHARTDENERALAIVERALSEVGDVIGRSWEAELQRQRALILLALDPSRAGEAEVYLQKSIEVAREQSAGCPSNCALPQASQNSGRRKKGVRKLGRSLNRFIVGFRKGLKPPISSRRDTVQSALH